MWPRKIGSVSFHVRRDRSPRKIKAPLRVPMSRATEPVAGLSVGIMGFPEARRLCGMADLLTWNLQLIILYETTEVVCWARGGYARSASRSKPGRIALKKAFWIRRMTVCQVLVWGFATSPEISVLVATSCRDVFSRSAA